MWLEAREVRTVFSQAVVVSAECSEKPRMRMVAGARSWGRVTVWPSSAVPCDGGMMRVAGGGALAASRAAARMGVSMVIVRGGGSKGVGGARCRFLRCAAE
jgi:hypothetical protein